MMRPYDSCTLSTSCTPTAPCVSTVRCTSELRLLVLPRLFVLPSFVASPRPFATSVPCPPSARCPVLAIVSGRFYWALHPMSSQQSLAIWVSHFFESARSSSSFISSITFLETLLPQPSFRGKDTKKGYSAVLVRCTPVANTDSGTIEANRG